ncbi:MAG: 4Fe-4S binding protein [Oliverpabstia sp.]
MKRIDLHNISAKQRKKIHTYLRAFIQLLYFLFLPSAFTAAFAGVKYIFTQIGAGEKIEITSFVSVLITLCLFTLVFGRFFCGFACAFGSFGDGVHAVYLWVCKKIKKKPIKLKESWAQKLTWVKYLVLLGIALMCFGGVYGKVRGTSPWDVFSMLHAGNLNLGGYIPGIVILVLLVVGMCIQERFFCRFFCPMGAVFALLPVLPFFSLRRKRESCIRGCSGCTKKCPADLELPSDGSIDTSGECFQCQKCIDTCPKGNIHCGISRLKGNEVVFTLLRAVFLLILFWKEIRFPLL